MATLGGAKSLDCEQDIGNFKIGKEADFIVLDPESDAHNEISNAALRVSSRNAIRHSPARDDRAVSATYANGHCVHRRDADEKV